MYRKILLALENDRADVTLLPHVAKLAKLVGAELLLVHVADGWAARNFDQLRLAESEEMKSDSAYLERVARELRAEGLTVNTELARGNPPQEILHTAVAKNCDLIAMTSHGHKLVGDLFFGSTIEKVRHNTTIPLLILRAQY
jgi:nucleotide-binding universal stress UspA family protein